MGWEFRTGNYHKNVRIGKRTVKDGEAVGMTDGLLFNGKSVHSNKRIACFSRRQSGTWSGSIVKLLGQKGFGCSFRQSGF